ncbi:hypothetical protein [Corallincola holothuriorum]|nr:hypothetical protein [Corallincola holothuriorum]
MMCEDWGFIVISAPEHFLSKLDPESADGSPLVAEIASLAGVTPNLFNGLHFQFEQLGRANGLAWFVFDCAHWPVLLSNLTLPIADIQIYARIQDDEGRELFYALPEEGERLIVIWDGEEMSTNASVQPVADETSLSALAKWQSLVPDKVKSAVPEFLEIEL